ncbi:MAG: RnfABCDGE type electron transport complex subunit D [Alkalispirochaeta sp.]
MTAAMEIPFPHTFQRVTVRSLYLKLTLALAPLLVFASIRDGMSTISVFAVTLAAGAVTEFLADLIRSGTASSTSTKNGRVLYFTALLTLLLPPGVPLPVAGVAAVVMIVVGVHLLGANGSYYVHPVFVALLAIAGSGVMSAIPAGTPPVGPLADLVSDSLIYRTILDQAFVPLGMRVPPEALALIVNMGDVAASGIGAGMIPALLIGALIVYGEELVPASLSAAFLAGGITVFVAADADLVDILVRSNFLVVAIFALADPSIRPLRRGSIVLYGAVAGALAAVLLVTRGAVFPVVTAATLIGTLRPLLDLVVRKR